MHTYKRVRTRRHTHTRARVNACAHEHTQKHMVATYHRAQSWNSLESASDTAVVVAVAEEQGKVGTKGALAYRTAQAP